MFLVITNKNRAQDTLKNICRTLFLLCLLCILHVWAYQVCCSKNYFQQNDQTILFTFYKNRKWLSQRQICQISWPVKKYWKMTISAFLVIICGWISWPEGQSHQDINGRKLRKLGKSQERDESVLHLAHAQPNTLKLAKTTKAKLTQGQKTTCLTHTCKLSNNVVTSTRSPIKIAQST